jgi:hypothetical protein
MHHFTIGIHGRMAYLTYLSTMLSTGPLPFNSLFKVSEFLLRASCQLTQPITSFSATLITSDRPSGRLELATSKPNKETPLGKDKLGKTAENR